MLPAHEGLKTTAAPGPLGALYAEICRIPSAGFPEGGIWALWSFMTSGWFPASPPGKKSTSATWGDSGPSFHCRSFPGRRRAGRRDLPPSPLSAAGRVLRPVFAAHGICRIEIAGGERGTGRGCGEAGRRSPARAVPGARRTIHARRMSVTERVPGFWRTNDFPASGMRAAGPRVCRCPAPGVFEGARRHAADHIEVRSRHSKVRQDSPCGPYDSGRLALWGRGTAGVVWSLAVIGPFHRPSGSINRRSPNCSRAGGGSDRGIDRIRRLRAPAPGPRSLRNRWSVRRPRGRDRICRS